jgi:SecD/SecF fusion protein
MTSRTRNLSIIAAVLVLLAAAAVVIATKPTVLGLDLKGGVELVYQGRPTPQAPKVTPQAIDDAITTIRKRTDALGVSEPEIQRAGSNQISIGLPNVSNADRAINQVGTTAQLQFYDWEPNVYTQGDNGKLVTLQSIKTNDPTAQAAPFSGSQALFNAVKGTSTLKPKAEATDLPATGVPDAIKKRFGNDQKKIEQYYDRHNDTKETQYYLFGPSKRLISGPDSSCRELLSDFEGIKGPKRSKSQIPKSSECAKELAATPLGHAAPAQPNESTERNTGPPAGSQILKLQQGFVVIEAQRQPKQPASVHNYYVMEDDSALSGSNIKSPEVSSDQSRGNAVSMKFTKSGQKAFEETTKRIAKRGSEEILPPGAGSDVRNAALNQFVITLDNRVISLATIDFRDNPEGIDGKTGAEITGLNSQQEAQDLAQNLRIGALPIDLKLISQTTVSATLGQQALNQGLLAGAVGLGLTILFLLIFYRVLGGVAALALAIYAVLLFGLVKLIPITLTLPGIAGLILTLGVAADANIVIFERIKEEARHGRSIPAAISAGYAKALRTIVDANVVTIGVAFILFTLATAGIKGFAFTLGIGTIVSLFTAVLGTSAILGAMARTRLIGSRFAIGATKSEGVGAHFDFIGRAKWFFSMSGVILLVGALAIAGMGLKFGIDFESGTRIKTPLEKAASVAQVRNTLAPLGYADSKIQKVKEPELGKNVFQISTSTLQPNEVQKVRKALDAKYGAPQSSFQTNSIGPTFGSQIANTAVIAILASLALISIYIALRFETKFAVPVLIALAHDIFITAGVYALFGREVTTSTVAALLTILGYSLYDTIIVFDRVRENVPRMPRATFSQIVNRSMSEVIVRSLATSFSTLLPVTALMIFGGETLRDFAFALLVGVASGAYSSIFIAAPVLTLWKEREPTYVRRRRTAMAEHDGHVPAFATGIIEGDGAVAAEPGSGAPGSKPARRERKPVATGAVATEPAAPPPAAEPPAAPADAAPMSDEERAREEAKARRARNRARKKHGRH